MHQMRISGGYNICRKCGACKRRSGTWYLVGHYSKEEPPCTNGAESIRDSDWFKTAKLAKTYC